MKILLTAVNAKFIHSSLALRSLKKYASKYSENIFLKEFTINQETDFILSEIYKEKPDVIGFSCYIWNIGIISELVENLKKILPKTIIILGGPEVSYESEEVLIENPYADIIIRGEGEITFLELSEYFIDNTIELSNIDGITYRNNKNEILSTPKRKAAILDDIPFVYDDMTDLENRIIYYETQRGCPYNCQYCLSSIEKGVRFLSEERVKSDLQFFIDNNVKQVKFVDRTFNCNKKHAMMIWKYIMDNDNGITNFHMEITADIMDNESLELLKNARKGLFQFEIGVQSTNPKTIEAIKRNTSFEGLTKIVKKIKNLGNIHEHLDLIAGLPYEDYNSFRNSFNDVFALEPEQLQLGFLKLLKGSGLRRDAEKYGIVYRRRSNYEVLYTKEISYGEMERLKLVEEMTETYYNSGKALNTIKYITSIYTSPFDFFQDLGDYWESKGHHAVKHSKMELFQIMYSFSLENNILKDKSYIIKELLRFDIFAGDNVKTLPSDLYGENKDIKEKIFTFYKNEANIEKYTPNLKDFSYQQISRMCHIELFKYNVFDIVKNPKNNIVENETAVLFNYYKKDEISNKPVYYKIEI